MKASEFQSLCRGASKNLGLKNLDSLGVDGEVTLNDVAISVAFDEARSPTQIDVLVDMGEVDVANRMDVYEAMLAMNLTLDPAEQGALAMDLDSNHALLSAKVAWKQSMDSARLADMLKDYVVFARQFREDVLSVAPSAPVSLEKA